MTTVSGKIAVIDVGSNSCRLVIYERHGAAFLPYFNEKTMARLGQALPHTGCLSPEGCARALQTFRRFRSILTALKISDIQAVATAAVREARDGDAFRRQVEQVLGVPLKVLTGREEGALSARGVCLGFAAPEGLVADLGGTSLELCPVGGKDRPGETWLLGPLARACDDSLPLVKRRKHIRRILSDSALLKTKPRTLYTVGGAWRSMATVYMALTNYPLRVLHAFQLDRRAIRKVIKHVELAHQEQAVRNRLAAIAKRRYDTLLHAAIVLEALLEQGMFDEVTISAYGLRDGVVGKTLGEIRPTDRLVDSLSLFLHLSAESLVFGECVFAFVRPVIDQTLQPEAVFRAVCLMADAGMRLHPDHRAQLVYQRILWAPIPVFDHPARLFAALSIASSHTFRFSPGKDLEGLISSRLSRQARLLGAAIRLASVYSGCSGSILQQATLKIAGDRLVFSIPDDHAALVSSTVKHRHAQLSNLLGLTPVTETKNL